MSYYPAFLDLRERPCLVVGGGSLAAHKSHALLQAGAHVTVVAPAINATLRRRLHDPLTALRWREGRFEEQDLADVFLVIAATDDEETNRAVFRLAESRRLLVNAVDDQAHCNFILGARASAGPVQVAVSSSGACPTVATELRDRIVEQLLTPELGQVAELLRARRPRVKRAIRDHGERAAFWRALIPELLAHLTAGGSHEEADRRVRLALDQITTAERVSA